MNSIDNYSGKSILITGGAGYLATSIAGLLRDKACRIVRVDREEADFPSVTGKAVIEDIPADIRQSGKWQLSLGEVDIVFHF